MTCVNRVSMQIFEKIHSWVSFLLALIDYDSNYLVRHQNFASSLYSHRLRQTPRPTLVQSRLSSLYEDFPYKPHRTYTEPCRKHFFRNV